MPIRCTSVDAASVCRADDGDGPKDFISIAKDVPYISYRSIETKGVIGRQPESLRRAHRSGTQDILRVRFCI
jgi:hypothetical protein